VRVSRAILCWAATFAASAATAADGPPYSPSPVIEAVDIDWSTHRREAPGSDNWPLVWADDDHQYAAWGDGGGFGGTNGDGRASLGFARIEGDWTDYRGVNVWGGKNAENPAQFGGKSYGIISLDGVLYAWIVPDEPEGETARDHYHHVTLARSADHAATWTKADWRWRITDDLVFPTFLVFGKDNAGARDEYVYSYFLRPQSRDVSQSTHGLEVHTPGAVYLARVAQAHIFDGRDRYEWFSGRSGDEPIWGTLEERRPVFEDPNGTGWCMSASYNPGLGRYVLCTEHTASHSGVLGLFDAPEPWGPWTTVAYWTPTDRFGESRPGSDLPWRHNVFYASFSPKWLSSDGRTFTLAFTGGGRGADNDSFNTVRGRFVLRAGSKSP